MPASLCYLSPTVLVFSLKGIRLFSCLMTQVSHVTVVLYCFSYIHSRITP